MTRYYLAAQAPLIVTADDDVVLVVVDEGILLDEGHTPQRRMSVQQGTSVLIPKGERSLLRNVWDKKLEVVVVLIPKSWP